MRATSAARFAFVAELAAFHFVRSRCLPLVGWALFILHSKLMNVGSGVSVLLSKRELGKANSLLGRARGLVK